MDVHIPVLQALLQPVLDNALHRRLLHRKRTNPFQYQEDWQTLNNNNRGQNNRRRGRNNNNNSNNRGGNSRGGADSGNRIDNRTRGNAVQMLDKYKKLAQDAQMSDDGVNSEYYLQFADHYYRVIADNKARQDEERAKREEDRGGNNNRQDNRGDAHGDNRSSSNDRDDDEDNDNDRDDNRAPRRAPPRRNVSAANGKSHGGGNQDAVETKSEEPAKKRRGRPRKVDSEKSGAQLDMAVLPPAIGGDSPAEKPKAKRGRPRKVDSEKAVAAE